MTRHASRAVKETSKKSDSPDTRADIWRWAVETNQLAENSRLAVGEDPLHDQEEGSPKATELIQR